MKKQTVESFLADVKTGEHLVFKLNPNDIRDEKSTNFANVKVPGMSHPRYQYVSGEARKITFKVELFGKGIKAQIAWLRSLLYPEHSGLMLRNAPHRVLFEFGGLFVGMQFIVRSVKARYFHMFEAETLKPNRAEVDFVLEEYVEQSVDFGDIRK